MDKEAKNSVDIFQKAVTILNQNKVCFWLDQGTLLGCIRENRLLPWDHDIDFGVWKDQVDRELLINCFMNLGFQLENIPYEMDCIHLLSNYGKKVDITFYEIEGAMATVKWVAPVDGIFCRVIKMITNSLDDSSKNLQPNQTQYFKRVIITMANWIVHILPRSLKKKLSIFFKPLVLKYPTTKMVKFSIPLEILSHLKNIVFLDMNVKIPIESEKYLSLVYGNDWIIPKESFNWWQECGGLESI